MHHRVIGEIAGREGFALWAARTAATLGLVASALCACGSSGSSSGSPDAAAPPGLTCPVVVSSTNCDTSLRPIVFVHGTYGSGDNFEHIAALLGSNGYCQDRIVAIDYNSLGDSPGEDCTSANDPQGCGKIDALVDQVLAANPAFTQVDLAGHSQGTAHCGTYLGLHADKVAHYINFSSPQSPALNVGAVQTLSISSLHDLGGHPNHCIGDSVCTLSVDGGAPVPSDAGTGFPPSDAGDDGGEDGGPPPCNVIQVTFEVEDHFALAASTPSFIQVYRYLNGGKDPQYTTVQCGDDPVTIEGVAETFADNTPVTGMVQMHELSGTPRVPGPDITVPPSDSSGHFGPIQIKRGVEYEIAGYDAQGNLVGYQYFTPFVRDNRLMRLLTPASSSDGSSVGGLIAGLTTGHAIRSANSVTVLARWYGGAFRQDLGATLTVGGTEVLTSANSGDQALATSSLAGGTVGLFMDDANQNGKTDLGLPYSTFFIAFTDVYLPATMPAFVDYSFTPGQEDPSTVGEALTIANWPSSVGLVAVTFQ